MGGGCSIIRIVQESGGSPGYLMREGFLCGAPDKTKGRKAAILNGKRALLANAIVFDLRGGQNHKKLESQFFPRFVGTNFELFISFCAFRIITVGRDDVAN